MDGLLIIKSSSLYSVSLILLVITFLQYMQDDSHSYLVTEKLISAVVPSWLQKFENPRLLLEVIIFVQCNYINSGIIFVSCKFMYAFTDNCESAT